MHDLVIRGGTIVDGTGRPAFRGDLAVDGDRIAAVGATETGRRVIDADGCLVTPGFVDAHTHLDAQLFWDPLGTPACWHGTTTVVIGNCGVGFAPVRPADRQQLARVLESVEEIPAESAMASLPFHWESFPEFLDSLGAQPLGVNVAALIGHAATRLYAMGEASVDPKREPRANELAIMQQLVAEALEAGALGFSTSRTRTHTTPEGEPIPGTFAREGELFAIADVLRQQDAGVLQWVSGFGEEDRGDGYPEARREVRRIAATSRRAGRPAIFSTFTHEGVPTIHVEVMEEADAEAERGARIRPMFGPRVGMSLIGLKNRSPLRAAPWRDLYELPEPERLAALEDPVRRAQLIDVPEQADQKAAASLHLFGPDQCDYEHPKDRALATEAQRRGVRPVEAIVDLLRESGGRQLFAKLETNQNPRHIEEMLEHPALLIGLGDAGAHVASICDSSLTTHVVSHWCRDRGRFSIEEGVRRLTSDPAEAFGVAQRGRLEAGFFADVNVIDLARLEPDVPEFVFDLPRGAGRWTQRARGYVATLVNGHVAIENGCHTGRLAGGLLRGPGSPE